jgi:hypothetical protein
MPVVFSIAAHNDSSLKQRMVYRFKPGSSAERRQLIVSTPEYTANTNGNQWHEQPKTYSPTHQLRYTGKNKTPRKARGYLLPDEGRN